MWNQDRFVGLVRKARLPSRQDAGYAEELRVLHSGILGLCALIESFPYSVEPWMPLVTDGEFHVSSRLPQIALIMVTVTIGSTCCTHYGSSTDIDHNQEVCI